MGASDSRSISPAFVPVVDVAPLVTDGPGQNAVGQLIGNACREPGFFYAVGHGVSAELCLRLEEMSRAFFAQDETEKMRIRMALGGRAWRGYFPVGDELTSGKPDQKEGIYFGAELPDTDPRVVAGLPLHGRNLFPGIDGFRETVLEYLDALTRLGHALMAGVAMSLGLAPRAFAERYTADPFILFRIFNYPAQPATAGEGDAWGVGEHTDYGLLTILKQDDVGGLEIKRGSVWAPAPPILDSFVCNVGDMLERMTDGLYRSTPHRVRNTSARDRLSFPFFFDPSFDAEIQPTDGFATGPRDQAQDRWDGRNIYEFRGTYGQYLLSKVSKVFPDLGSRVL